MKFRLLLPDNTVVKHDHTDCHGNVRVSEVDVIDKRLVPVGNQIFTTVGSLRKITPEMARRILIPEVLVS